MNLTKLFQAQKINIVNQKHKKAKVSIKSRPYAFLPAFSGTTTYDEPMKISTLMSGSCHLDRTSNVEIGVECQIFVIVIFFNCD